MARNQTEVAVNELAIWDAPHDLERDGVGVFSYGLLLPEVNRLSTVEGRAWLAARWGAHEVQQLAEDLAPDLTNQVREEAITRGIDSIVVMVDSDVTIQNPDSGGFTWPFAMELHRVAGARASVPLGWEEQLRRFLDDVARPDRFVWRWARIGATWSRVRVPRYDRLKERLAIEFDHLVTRRPRLSRCALCHRVFVPLRPSRPETHCRANLWQATRPPIQIERCVPLDDTERKREWKRRDQRYRRALVRAGGDVRHPDVVAAKRALGDWVRDHPPARRGRQEHPTVGLISTKPDETDGDSFGPTSRQQ
jgi:hypothetical protein